MFHITTELKSVKVIPISKKYVSRCFTVCRFIATFLLPRDVIDLTLSTPQKGDNSQPVRMEGKRNN